MEGLIHSLFYILVSKEIDMHLSSIWINKFFIGHQEVATGLIKNGRRASRTAGEPSNVSDSNSNEEI